ncbi:D-glycero-beta-D-manno-heptose 1,7-bisphosphate 7-phosphatase [Candidatus Venteria ishoeyi]|uniref:D,D-heptose 1,7-bisphosphate phosphatase n=1 Tax=Candidatus Venteria ishoeyi TaxID=1899563 RepID=A0A1H6FI40_9GAMM|nr:D-glycero-beta-D-manno-heptose 1,7-bisphosphate 7-phosphatase [Candidatus Venteria ishoeyi]MDM8546870.1 D-glycero-beta-D-manno-heptose 1,7-bisphosphate 7-phosphatase [Candidatus Venteria ishoeyi]SEH08684.1 D-glycero-beta-D-manno-heptose-1%2C7-bisphosphate7-phosphatase [Candidatus Venteria ishoeyi]
MQLVILDRDGVINQDSEDFIKSPDEWRAIPGSLEAIAQLTQSGYRVVVATNQSGLARGLFTIDTLTAIHDKMCHALTELGGSIDAIFFCPHGPRDACLCRKPKPGLFKDIGRRLGINLTGIPAIGDSLRDLQAARAAGAQPILVRTGKGVYTESLLADYDFDDIPVYDDLNQAVLHLLKMDEVY